MRSILLGCVVALGVVGGAMAKTVTADDAAQFKVGEATLQDVETKLGKPQSTSSSSDGTVAIAYSSVKTSVKAATWIPVVGLFAGGARAQTSLVTFVFGADGLLKTESSTESNADCNMGSCK